ncbi:phosphotransferase [Williamsia sp. 1138]|uniref:DUF7064 domain-containing protein n=1 Tax=Williamsia sp. 1138 TaxID=1903117 RepID=UPI000A115D1C|nr:phosphotransferase [Williamsia sp. 1138]OZG27410.1 phosphotransferase [Williamsia sp. 1138]
MSTPTVIAVTEDLTADWLTGVIGGGSVGAFETTRIGTGQMSESHRVRVRYDDGGGPESVVLKIAASDETSRSTGVSLGLYEREVRFYADIAGSIGPGALARCHHASYEADSGTFALVLEDAGPAEVGNDILGATLGQAELAVRALARIQSAVLGNDELAATDWLNREAPINQALLASLFPAFLDRYGSRLDPRHRDLAQQMVDSWDAYLAEQQAMPHQSLIHGDFRLDNLLFGQPGAARPVTVVDWQTVAWGPATNDLAYFLGASLPTELRRAHFDDLLQIYFDGLGGRGPASVDEVRDGVRKHTFFGILMTIVPSVIVEQTDRGDEMFMTMFARHCELALDLESAATLPAARALEPLAPEPTDEFAHTPGDEQLWNESWYFDVADAEAGVGAYVRIGVTPNQKSSWYTAMICGPGRPTVAVLDFDLPTPQDLSLSTENLQATHRFDEPLTTASVTLRGRGEAFDDPAAILRGEHGRAVEVRMDLQFTSAGDAYRYRVTPRYEIPCLVTGTIAVDGEVISLQEVPGQRDHSWGVRDWWGMDWVWSALHSPDGTHLHGLDLRIPDLPQMSIGYAQLPGLPLVELSRHVADSEFTDDGLPISALLEIEPGNAALTFEPLGHGPLRLQSEDGKVAYFARAWGRVTSADGTIGVGWIEWNRNQIS